MCIHVFVCVYANACTHICGDQKSKLGVFLYHPPPYLLSRVSHWYTSSLILQEQLAGESWNPCLHLPSAKATSAYHHTCSRSGQSLQDKPLKSTLLNDLLHGTGCSDIFSLNPEPCNTGMPRNITNRVWRGTLTSSLARRATEPFRLNDLQPRSSWCVLDAVTLSWHFPASLLNIIKTS